MVMDPILSRRSIRRYQNRPVEEPLVEYCLRAAMAAPSAHNQQPWAFVIIDNRQLLDAIPGFHPYSRMLYEAPMAILVCGDNSDLKSPDFWPQDCAAAVENILLAACSRGLGSVWMGVYPKEPIMQGFRRLLELPDTLVPFALVALGYGAEEKGPSDRYDPGRVYRNVWKAEKS